MASLFLRQIKTIRIVFHRFTLQNLHKNNNLIKILNRIIPELKNRGYKKTYIWKTPKILIIHIKRFIVNNFGIRAQKIINNVEYPLYDLDIKDYIHDKSPYKNNSIYNLIGVNLHQEFSNLGTNSGHYTSLVKSRHDNNWYLYNDGREPVKLCKKEFIQNKNAYLLFYYRND